MQTTSFQVAGGRPLSGSIEPKGAKNEALQVICASLLTTEKVTISNIPDIVDVRRQIDLLRGLGVSVERTAHHTYCFEAGKVDLSFLKNTDYQAKARSTRGSVLTMGALLGRFGKALLPKPGGDKIGRRRMDTHFTGLQKLGAHFRYDPDLHTYFIEAPRLKGTYILMDEISVTGTANILFAAVLAQGTTTLYNAACEPYIQQLCKLLNKMGAKISGIGSNLLTIEGVSSLGGATHTCLPDMIEVGSFIGLAAMTRSDLTIKSAGVRELGNILPVFRRMGVDLRIVEDDIHVPAKDEYEIQHFIDGSIMTVYDAPWPGFTPDLMSILLVMATQAKGSVLIHQKMFESRLFFVDKLIDMGAQIILCDPHRATVIGLNHRFPLRGIQMTSPDIRAGVALLIAALSAKGTSIINNIHQIDRGYENIDQRLNALGAEIIRV